MASLTFSKCTIPFDVWYNILTNLPAETLLRFKRVCKYWYNLINDPDFIQVHFKKSLETDSCHHNHHRPFIFTSDNSLYFGDDIESPSQALVKFNWHDNIILPEHEHVGFIDSSNGLVCLDILGVRKFIICNPLTCAFKLVPYPVEIMSVDLQWFALYGFGYDSQREDYKVVLINLKEDKETWVYSLKTDLWRKTPTQHQSPMFYKARCRPVFGHGMLHCILQGVSEITYSDDDQPRIARFNLSSEKWEDEDDDLGYPIDPTCLHNVHSTFLDGHLCLSIAMEHLVDIWILKEYGTKESWTKLLRVPSLKSFKISRPLAYSRTRPDFLWLNARDGGIVCYDMQHETSREELDFPKLFPNVQVNLCVPSLVSIPGSSHMRGQTHQAHEEKITTYK